MKVTSCKSSGMEVSPTAYNACMFQIIDEWNPDQHAKTCDTMFYLSDGTGAYVWDCDHWTFLDFTGVTQSDWAAKQNEAGYIKNKPFKTLGNGLVVDEEGKLNVDVSGLTLYPTTGQNIDGAMTQKGVTDALEQLKSDFSDDFVHKEGNERISGDKTFDGDTTFEGNVAFKGDVSFKDDVPWSDLPALPADWSYIYGNCGYRIRDKTLSINIFAVSTQKAVPVNTKTTLFKIPNVTLPANFTDFCIIQPGAKAVGNGKWELLKDGTLSIFNYIALEAQTGTNDNHFNFNITVPIV